MASDLTTQEEVSRREHELVELLRETGTEKSGWATLRNMEPPGVDEVQRMLEPDEILIEYYATGDRLQAFVIGTKEFEVVRDLTTLTAVRACVEGLNFQLAKFHLEPAYIKKHAGSLLASTTHHLHQLHRQLLRPLQHLLSDRRLIILPHQALHYVPFHALFDGDRYVVDAHEVTYGASAAVLQICRQRRPAPAVGRDLILAAADDLTPNIHDEVEALRELLPDARVFQGHEARESVLQEYGPTAGKIHIAAHGVFRPDNPMFSSLKLGDRWLNLYDIFNLQLGAELTTLSACETGMSAVWGGDELLGLARGFLYAGTPSLVVSLWTVNDRSTAELMKSFYRSLGTGLRKSAALRQAVLTVKKDYPHPYYWAPFVLMGKS
jgi:CHAT domain-containing protein